jgi:hypothetical protein
MTKSIEQTWEEIVRRNERSKLHQAAFTFWRESNYSRYDQYNFFKNFSRWWNPSWKLPDHVYPILTLFEKYFLSHKMIVTNFGEGVKMHLNPSRTQDPKNWKAWNTWSYTMCVPWDLNRPFDPVIILYGNEISEQEEDHIKILTQPDISKYNTIICQPYSRMSFASGKYPHGVCASDNRLLWIFSDLYYSDLPNHKPNVRILENIDLLEQDMKEVIHQKKPNGELYFTPQFMSDLEYFLTFKKYPTELDWIPPGL